MDTLHRYIVHPKTKQKVLDIGELLLDPRIKNKKVKVFDLTGFKEVRGTQGDTQEVLEVFSPKFFYVYEGFLVALNLMPLLCNKIIEVKENENEKVGTIVDYRHSDHR